MIRRSFLGLLAGTLGAVVSPSVQSISSEVPVSCPECGRPSMPRRRYKDATEYVCLNCAANGELPLAAYTFTRKANDPGYYCFFPADIEAAMVPHTHGIGGAATNVVGRLEPCRTSAAISKSPGSGARFEVVLQRRGAPGVPRES